MSHRTKRVLIIVILLALAISAATWFLLLRPKMRNSYKLVGTMQTQLGCQKDWDENCKQTTLGRTSAGLYEHNFLLEAGTYRFTINEARGPARWSAEGEQGTDSSLALADNARVTFTFDPKTKKTTLKIAD